MYYKLFKIRLLKYNVQCTLLFFRSTVQGINIKPCSYNVYPLKANTKSIPNHAIMYMYYNLYIIHSTNPVGGKKKSY